MKSSVSFLWLIFLGFSAFSQSARLNIAVNDLKGKGVDAATAGIISERVRSEFVKSGGFRVMERGEMESVLKEQGFQQSGACDDQACLVEAGQLLGVDRMIAGSVGKISSFYTVSLRMIHVGTGEILFTVDEDFKGDIEGLFRTALPNIARKAKSKSYGQAVPELLRNTHSSPTRVKSTTQTESATQGSGKCIDADGNAYSTVVIGNQEWTVENLRTTKYNDGTKIPRVTNKDEWKRLSTGAYCYYDNESATYADKYGALYNWYAVNTGKLAPAGWHVPTDAEWTQLEEYLIANGYNWDGSTSEDKIGKALAAKTDWRSRSDEEGDVGNDLSSNNSTGFSALPGGYRHNNGGFSGQSYYGGWWSATENAAAVAYDRSLYYDYESLSRDGSNKKKYGFSVRLVRD